jgi:predicted AlkP superfamily pyrophosphatase or phosphodiesterase
MRETLRTRPRTHVFLFVVILLSLAVSVAAQTAKRALVISVDGLDVRYLSDPDKYALKIPTLRRLMQNGATSRGVFSVYPSVTYPNHTSLVTGARPSDHGIVGNGIFEPPDQKQTEAWFWYARDIRADTLWQAAKRSGKRVGMVSWPVGIGAGDWNVPEIWAVDNNPLSRILRTRRLMSQNSLPQGLLEEIEQKVSGLYSKVTPDEGDDMRTRMAEYILTEKRPDVMLVHLFDLDHFEHKYGPFTPEALAMLEKSDAYVARLLDALRRAGTLDETAVFIGSDHGFKPISRQLHPGVLLKNASLVESKVERDEFGKEQNVITNWKAAVYVNSASCAIYLKDPNDRESLRKLHEIFDPLAGRPGSGIHKVLDTSELRRLGSNTTAVIMLDPAEGFTFGSNYFGEFNVPSRTKGMHGYLPNSPDYAAGFIASGAGITRRGWIDSMEMPDAGATIAKTIGLQVRGATGKAANLSVP